MAYLYQTHGVTDWRVTDPIHLHFCVSYFVRNTPESEEEKEEETVRQGLKQRER